jgi:hypothetical protein
MIVTTSETYMLACELITIRAIIQKIGYDVLTLGEQHRYSWLWAIGEVVDTAMRMAGEL